MNICWQTNYNSLYTDIRLKLKYRHNNKIKCFRILTKNRNNNVKIMHTIQSYTLKITLDGAYKLGNY